MPTSDESSNSSGFLLTSWPGRLLLLSRLGSDEGVPILAVTLGLLRWLLPDDPDDPPTDLVVVNAILALAVLRAWGTEASEPACPVGIATAIFFSGVPLNEFPETLALLLL